MTDQQAHIEILLRGEVIKLFAEIENTLAIIVIFCHSNKVYETEIDSAIKFKGMTLEGKINMATELLIDYHPKVYEANKQLLLDINCLRKFRNRIAHCAMSWKEGVTSEFIIWDIERDVEGVQYYKDYHYTFTECSRLLDEIESCSKKLLDILPLISDRHFEMLRNILAGRSPIDKTRQ